MLHKWNHNICKLLGLAFFTQQNFLETDPGCRMYQYFILIPLYCRAVFHCMDISQFIFILYF